VLEPEHGMVAIGSGGAYAQAAPGTDEHTELSAEDVVRQSLAIAGELCIYTNMNHTIEPCD
jgi:ATP-dependent HslUV protease, peptidase subunit HslV